MSLKQQLQDDMKTALRSHDAATLSTIRMALAAIKQVEVDERVDVDDTRFIAIVTKMVKQRKESAQVYETGHRHDLAEKELAEILILQKYLPQMMGTDAVTAAVTTAIAETGASQPSDMGKVMGILKTRLAGKADMGEVSKILKQALSA